MYFRVHKSLPMNPILSQLNPMPPLFIPLTSTLISYSYLCLVFCSGLLSSSFQTKTLYRFSVHLIRVRFGAYLTLSEMTIIVFGIQQKLSSLSIFTFLHPLVLLPWVPVFYSVPVFKTLLFVLYW